MNLNKTDKLLILFSIATAVYLTVGHYFAAYCSLETPQDGVLAASAGIPGIVFTLTGCVSGVCVLIFLIRYIIWGTER
jgi:hypothetical protein